MKEYMDDLLKKVKEFWENPNTEENLWKAIAKSYIEKDQDLEKQQIFITQISFYPNLIDTLINVLDDKAKNSNYEISLNIRFFSTLLPRHYWNFPLEYKDKDNIHIDAPVFLDTYRKSIENCVNTKSNISVNIERVLIIASSSTRNIDGNTILFCEKDLEEDKEYTIPDISIGKTSWLDFLKKNKDDRNSYLIDIDDLGNTSDSYKGKINKKSQIYLLERKEGKSTKRNSLYDYYIEKLHSKSGAKLLVVCPKGTSETIIKKNSGFCLEKDFDGISPNLSIIEIKIKNDATNENRDFEYLLDTYMDLKMSIVRLQIWDLKEEAELKEKIAYLYDQAKEIKVSTKVKGIKPKSNKRTNQKPTMQEEIKELVRQIKTYSMMPENTPLEMLAQEVIDMINKDFSNDKIKNTLKITKGREINFQLLNELKENLLDK